MDEQPDEVQHGSQPREPGEPTPPNVAAGDVSREPAAPDGTTAEAPEAATPPRVPLLLRPIDALGLLEDQWASRVPLAERRDALLSLRLVPYWATGWLYLETLTGADEATIEATYAAWLGAQLAADALDALDSKRPRVQLLPLGRLWYAVRRSEEGIVAIDGPGFPTPLAALRTARLRYRAELEAAQDDREATEP